MLEPCSNSKHYLIVFVYPKTYDDVELINHVKLIHVNYFI